MAITAIGTRRREPPPCSTPDEDPPEYQPSPARDVKSPGGDKLNQTAEIPIIWEFRQAYIKKVLTPNSAKIIHNDDWDHGRSASYSFRLSPSMTLAELEREATLVIMERWDKDVTTHEQMARENQWDLMGGVTRRVQRFSNIAVKPQNDDGWLKTIDCEIDVSGSGSQLFMTKMNVPNEETWDAAKDLIRKAKGESKVIIMFAVQVGGYDFTRASNFGQ